jgi:hypothetical protein
MGTSGSVGFLTVGMAPRRATFARLAPMRQRVDDERRLRNVPLIDARRPIATADDFDPAADRRAIRRIVFHGKDRVARETLHGHHAAFIGRADVFVAAKDAPSHGVHGQRCGTFSGGDNARAALVARRRWIERRCAGRRLDEAKAGRWFDVCHGEL